jgi:hypothetical protein
MNKCFNLIINNKKENKKMIPSKRKTKQKSEIV